MVRTLPPSQSLDESKSRPWGPPVIPSKSLDESKIQPGGTTLDVRPLRRHTPLHSLVECGTAHITISISRLHARSKGSTAQPPIHATRATKGKATNGVGASSD